MNAKGRKVSKTWPIGLIVAALATAPAACSQGSPTDIVASEDCVLIRDQIYCP